MRTLIAKKSAAKDSAATTPTARRTRGSTAPEQTTLPALSRGIAIGPYRWRWRWRPVLATAGALAATMMVGVLALTVGEFPISPLEAVHGLLGVGSKGARLIVVEFRAPRVVVGLLAGAAFGLAGALTQTVARNPLASPDLLGVTLGASLGAVTAIVLGGGSYAITAQLLQLGVPGCALAGGLVSAALVVGVSWRRGLSPYRLVLVGIGVGAVLTAMTRWLLTAARINDAGQASVWLVGSLSARGWEQAVPLACAMLVLMPLALALAGPLSTVQLGDEPALAVGARVHLVQLGAVLVAVGLSAAAVAAAGAVQFVALVVPQVMLRLTGGPRPPLLASAAGGALLVTTADLVGRVVWTWEVPVGLLTAAIGAPYLIWLLTRGRRSIG